CVRHTCVHSMYHPHLSSCPALHLMIHIRFSFHFFSSSYRDHRDLHSFPTRRSSDLHRPESRDVALSMRPGSAQCRPARSAPGARSEEHTSELQSHLNLVCRLLLEKKN